MAEQVGNKAFSVRFYESRTDLPPGSGGRLFFCIWLFPNAGRCALTLKPVLGKSFWQKGVAFEEGKRDLFSKELFSLLNHQPLYRNRALHFIPECLFCVKNICLIYLQNIFLCYFINRDRIFSKKNREIKNEKNPGYNME